ncbi:MAG: LPS export ABC transporter periplasmic protein LptC [Gammaproteobacteria bacterium]|nr:LPS export ABC transporter periplasmic protein LptC [Gammaproteobacteria bacterium]
MLERQRFPLLLVALAIGALLVQSLLDELNAPEFVKPKSGADRPDYTMTGLHTRRFDAQGRVVRDLHAERLDHYADARGSLMREPRLETRTALGKPWRIAAEEGQAPPEQDRILLRRNVLISREASLNNQGLELRTDTLRVTPEQNYAETEAPAELRSRGMVTTGTGLKAWLDKEQLQLQSDVRGQYEPTSRRTTPRR